MAPVSSTTAANGPPPAFDKDEKVLCFHHELLYEAKIVDIAPAESSSASTTNNGTVGSSKTAGGSSGGWKYKVHYKGWKHTWDDWVSPAQLRKMTAENRELANTLKKDLEAINRRKPMMRTGEPIGAAGQKRKLDSGQTSGRASEDRTINGSVGLSGPNANSVSALSSIAANTAGTSSRIKRRDAEMEREDAFLEKPAVRIPLPDSLKSILVDDWENVTKETKLVPLPSRTPVSLILDQYLAHESANRQDSSAEQDVLREVIAGLKAYFTKCIGKILLYRDERRQFASLYAMTESPDSDLGGKSMVEVYGAEHLLRLLSQLPELVAKTNMDKPSVNRLREELTKFSFWLGSSRSIEKYLSTPYEQWSADDVALTRPSTRV